MTNDTCEDRLLAELKLVVAQQASTEAQPAPRRTHRVGWTVAVGGAAVLVGALVATQLMPSGPPVSVVQQASAPALLLQIAAAVEKLPAGAHSGQWIYLKSISTQADVQYPSPARPGEPPAPRNGMHGRPAVPAHAGTLAKPGPLERREDWSPVDAHSPLRPMYREGGTDTEIERAPGSQVSLAEQGDYQSVLSLPADPDALLKLIYADQRTSSGDIPAAELDEFVFGGISEIVSQSIVPPKIAAALYRAAAKIPGLIVTPDITDAAGRHGVGIGFPADKLSLLSTTIFDKKTLAYLGSKTVLVKDTVNGKAGMVMAANAVVARGFVNKRGDTP